MIFLLDLSVYSEGWKGSISPGSEGNINLKFLSVFSGGKQSTELKGNIFWSRSDQGYRHKTPLSYHNKTISSHSIEPSPPPTHPEGGERGDCWCLLNYKYLVSAAVLQSLPAGAALQCCSCRVRRYSSELQLLQSPPNPRLGGTGTPPSFLVLQSGSLLPLHLLTQRE